MKRKVIILSSVLLGLAFIANTALSNVICVKSINSQRNRGTCYSSNSSDNQACLTPRSGDAPDCQAAIGSD
jgi:hypothetical protein